VRRLVALAVLLSPTFCWAEDGPKPIQVIPPGEDTITALPKGTPAPYDGQLFDNDTALRWANWLQQYKYRLVADVEEQKAICAVRTEELRQEILADQVKYNKTVQAYEEQVAQLVEERDNPPFYETTWFGLVVGAVGATAITAVTTWAAVK
jgi:hypothetical protein